MKQKFEVSPKPFSTKQKNIYRKKSYLPEVSPLAGEDQAIVFANSIRALTKHGLKYKINCKEEKNEMESICD